MQHTATPEKNKLSVTGLVGLVRGKCLLAGYALSCTEERQAVDLYAWPLPLRLAGFVTALSALVGTLAQTVHQGPLAVSATVALWVPYIAAFHLFSMNKYLTFTHRLVLFLAQAVSATLLVHLSFGFGAEVLFYMLAAEIQFLLPLRLSIYATVGLWLLLVVNVSFVADPYFQHQMVQYWVTTITGFVFVAAFTRSAVTELIQRRRSTILLEELNETHAQLQRYADRVEELAVTRERNRMAREIHDTLGHYLTVINIQIESAQKLSNRDPERSREAMSTAKQLATECLNEVRRSVSALRPAALDDLSLSDAVSQLADEFRHCTDVTMHLQTKGEGTLQTSVEVIAYRAIQEALTNVRKHAAARNVWVSMEWNREQLVATIRDDGRGVLPEPDTAGYRLSSPLESVESEAGWHSSFGLHGMRERLARVGGDLEIETAPGEGFCVTLRIPHPAESSPFHPSLQEAPFA